MPTLPQHPGAWARVTTRIRDPVCGSNRKGRDLFELAVWGQAGALGAARWGSASQGTPPAGLWKGNGVGSSQPEPLRAPASAHGPAAPPVLVFLLEDLQVTRPYVQGGAAPQPPRQQEPCPACRRSLPGTEPGLNLAAEAFIPAGRAGALAAPHGPSLWPPGLAVCLAGGG